MIAFAVYGLPGPQGSKRYVGTSKSGRGILVESSAKVKPWREAVVWAAREAMAGPNGWASLDCPLRVRMVFTLPKPASAPKRRQTWPMRTPDLSKLVRATEDAITSAGLWQDDARVVECVSAKRYPGEGEQALASPGCVITIEVIG